MDLGLIVDDVEDLLAKIMLFKQVTEVEDRSFVGYRIIAGQTDEFAKGKRIVESIFHAGIAEIVCDLADMNPKHSFERNRRTTVHALVVKGTYSGRKVGPWNDLVELREKLVSASYMALAIHLTYHVMFGVAKTELLRHGFVLTD